MTTETAVALLIAAGAVAFFVLLDKGADALREKYRQRLPRGGLVGLLWRKLSGAISRNRRR